MPVVRAISLLLAFSTACADDGQLSFACPSTCYTGPEGTAGVGECRFGRAVCVDREVVGCAGEVTPQAERCDHRDWNCDGIAEGPEPEVCDGADNDCDNEIDEGLPVEFCYEGPPNTVTVGQCSPGVRVCLDGEWLCTRQSLPLSEVCDGLDNDCDGETDEGEEPRRSNVVLVIDQSGSMSDFRDVVETLYAGLDHEWFDYWVFHVPVRGTDESGPDPDCHEAAPLRPCGPRSLDARAQEWQESGGAVEHVWDVLYDIYTGVYDIDWIPGAQRTVIVIVHETEDRNPTARGLTQADLAAVAGSPFVTYVYALEPGRYADFANEVRALGPPDPLVPSCR